MKIYPFFLGLILTLGACKTQLPFKSLTTSEGGGFTGATRTCSIDASGNVNQTSILKEESTVVFVRKLSKSEMKDFNKNTPVDLILSTDYNQPGNYTFGISMATAEKNNKLQWENPTAINEKIQQIFAKTHRICFK